MNAIELLKQDHKEASALMDQIKAGDTGDGRSTRELFNELNSALQLHTKIEEEIFYPALRNHDETRDMISEAFEEHREVKEMLAELSTMSPGNQGFMDRFSELKDSVEHHVEEEENELFPKAEKILGQSRLMEMGSQMQQMKQGKSATATTRPQ
jgi:hemerythrin-like domain-containing protein